MLPLKVSKLGHSFSRGTIKQECMIDSENKRVRLMQIGAGLILIGGRRRG